MDFEEIFEKVQKVFQIDIFLDLGIHMLAVFKYDFTSAKSCCQSLKQLL